MFKHVDHVGDRYHVKTSFRLVSEGNPRGWRRVSSGIGVTIDVQNVFVIFYEKTEIFI